MHFVVDSMLAPLVEGLLRTIAAAVVPGASAVSDVAVAWHLSTAGPIAFC